MTAIFVHLLFFLGGIPFLPSLVHFVLVIFKVHLDSYNMLPYLTGKEDKVQREEFLYWNDGGQLSVLRYDD